MRGPGEISRSRECLGIRFQFTAIGFGLVEGIAAQRDLDRSPQQSGPGQPILAGEREPDRRPRAGGVTAPAGQQCFAGLRIHAEQPGLPECSCRAVEVTQKPTHLAELVVPLSGRPSVDLLERPARQ